MDKLFGFAAGLVFGLGLILAGMTDPAKVKGFLDLAGAWDPSLALVMGGAIALGLPVFVLAGRRARAWSGAPMQIPTERRIDARLLGGGVLFGIGWGIGGFCPGPALVALGSGLGEAGLFVAAMLAGMVLHDRFLAPRPPDPGALTMLIFRQLFDTVSSTYTYLLGDASSGEALLIDPVYAHAQRDSALLRELGLHLVATLDTHVHADHVTGAWLLKQRCGSRIGLSAVARADGVDLLLADGDRVAFGRRHVGVRATPGHTDGCLSYVLDDESMAFTGDSLLIRGCGRTDFQQGSPARLFDSVRRQILSLPAHCLLYPGHDYRGLTVTSVAEELRFNPRLGGDANLADFTGYMTHLGLPHPKLIDIAVPANLRCGRPDGGAALPPEPEMPDWAPLTYTFGGLWEIAPTVLEERLAAGGPGAIQLVDVREPAEFGDALGHIAGARLLPLSDLAAQADRLDRTRPVVTVCRSGTRSAQAVVLLQKAGFGQLANLAGGMLRWRAEGLAVEDGAGG